MEGRNTGDYVKQVLEKNKYILHIRTFVKKKIWVRINQTLCKKNLIKAFMLKNKIRWLMHRFSFKAWN